MSIAFEQQRRKAFEPPARDWETTKAAILEARGARECADVGAEEERAAWERERVAAEQQYAAGQAQADPPYAIWTNGRDLFGEPKTLIDVLYEDKYFGVGDER
jgi:hypothetical protein